MLPIPPNILTLNSDQESRENVLRLWMTAREIPGEVDVM